MSRGIDRARDEQAHRGPDRAQHRPTTPRPRHCRSSGRILPAQRLLPRHIEPEKPLPDVPLHKRGFGVTDEDAP